MLTDICVELGFPPEAISYFVNLSHRIAMRTQLLVQMEAAKRDYLDGGSEHPAILTDVAKSVDASQYSIHMLLLLQCAVELRDVYQARGLEDGLFLDTMRDLRTKLLECRRVYGVWGTFVLHWFRSFFLCERFTLGRLQYERRPWVGPGYDPWLIEGEPAWWCHIPSGTPCHPEDVLDSLRRAYDFFGIGGGIFAVGCKSWMLYPPHMLLFPEGGNLAAFQKNFRVFFQQERENIDLWRIFGRKELGDPSTLPKETTLQRNFAAWLSCGNRMGIGAGLLLFDGKTILTFHE